MATALILRHIFRDLGPERTVLEASGIRIVDGAPLDPSALAAAAAEADAVLVQFPTTADAALIGRMARCRVIGAYGVGYNHIDVAAARGRGITVVHVPDYGTEEVSDHTLALLLACARGLPRLGASIRTGVWDYASAGPVHRLRGRTLGIVGLGRIGRRTAAKARAFGLRILATDPYIPRSLFAEHGAEPRPLDALLRDSDLVALHVPLTPETTGLIDARAFALMKPGAYLVNTARGPAVDEKALVAALDSGRLAGAGLDVLAVEPPSPDHPLLRDPRVLVTPHSAWYTEESKADLKRLLAEDIARVLSGQPARCPVDA